jgi:hypothetical protein
MLFLKPRRLVLISMLVHVGTVRPKCLITFEHSQENSQLKYPSL